MQLILLLLNEDRGDAAVHSLDGIYQEQGFLNDILTSWFNLTELKSSRTTHGLYKLVNDDFN